MFPSRSPYLRLSLILGLFIPAFVGGLFLAFSTGQDAPDQHRHQHQHAHQHAHQHQHDHFRQSPAATAKLEDLEARLNALHTTTTTGEAQGRKVHKIVDQMPIFPGRKCGDIVDYKKRKKCADRAMLEYIYQNVKYPKRAKKNGTEGLAVVSFVVESYGVISNIKVVRDPGSGLGDAAAKTVRKMYKDNLRWEPGLHKGKPVAVQFNLPVKFKLEG